MADQLRLFLAQICQWRLAGLGLLLLVSTKLVHKMLVSNLLSSDILLLIALTEWLLASFTASNATHVPQRSVRCHICELRLINYWLLLAQLGRIGLPLGLRLLILHDSLLRLINVLIRLIHMSLILVTTIITSTSVLAHSADERFALLVILLVSDIDEWTRIRISSLAIMIVTVPLLSAWVDVRVRVVEACLRTIYDIAVGTPCAVIFCVGALILGLLWTLGRPSKSTHRIWKFTLSFSDDLEWLFLSLEKQAVFITVWRRICEGVDPIYRLKVVSAHSSINACSVIAYIYAVLVLEHSRLVWILWGWCASIVLGHTLLRNCPASCRILLDSTHLLGCKLIKVFVD